MASNDGCELTPGVVLHGFKVLRVTPLPPPDGVAVEATHAATGARVLHLFNDDPENLFSVTFPTPPPDDTGVPHILEHSVLGGSKKFPVRDPFFELVKISMATFINAMTFWDRTVYPVASNVRQDLFNLAEVYFDAVFHPLLTENIFKREGHHLAPEAAAPGGLTLSGIVFNEMKGVFSNPECLLDIQAQRHLFPDSIYGRESGGDPERIPDLDYASFRAFYETHYHPSRALWVFYGNIPTAEYLAFLEPRLAGFGRAPAAAPVGRQPGWSAPRSKVEPYAVGAGEPLAGRTFLHQSWRVGDGADARDTAAWHLLSLLLLGHEAAPLKKRLVEARLGEDLVAAGAEVIGLELVFRVGLKGSEPDRAAAFCALVEETLREWAGRPFPSDSVAAAFQQTAYEYLEIVPGHPLRRLFHVMQSWVYGRDPLAFVRMRGTLDALRADAEADPMLFSRMIRERLLDNPHRLLLTLQPDPDLQAALEAREAEGLNKRRAGLTDADLARLADEAAQLDRESGTPNPPEAVASLPQLRRADLPDRPVEIPTSLGRVGEDIPMLRAEVPANGVCYLQLYAELDGLPDDLWAFLPRYTDALAKMGTRGQSYEAIARRKAARLGGLGACPWLQGRADDPAGGRRGLRFYLKTLDQAIEPALALFEELFFDLDPRASDRLRDVLIQARAHARTELVQGGTMTPLLHAGRGFSVEGHLRELIGGVPQLHQLERVAGASDQESAEVAGRIEAVRDVLLTRGRWTVGFTGSDAALDAVRAALGRWSGRFGRPAAPAGLPGYARWTAPVREGLAAPLQIAHCARVMPAPHFTHDDEPLIALGAHLLAFDYVLPEIRFKGNAYGASCRHDGLMRTFSFSSYRDPHILRTIEVFDGAARFVRDAPWGRADIDRAVIGKAREDLKPIRPADALSQALDQHLVGLTAGRRAERYRRRLAAGPAEVRKALLRVLEEGRSSAAVCVLARREKLEEANRARPGAAFSIEDLQPGG